MNETDNHWFQVDQGIPNPREPNEMGFRTFSFHADKKSAMKDARALSYARVLEVKVVARVGYE